MAKTKHTAMKCPRGSGNNKLLSKQIKTVVQKEKIHKNEEYDSDESGADDCSELEMGYSIISGKNFTMNPTFTILCHDDKIKRKVSLNFFDSLKAFKILRHWILLRYTGESGFIATEKEKKLLFEKWLKIHKSSFQPTTVDQIYKSSSAAREGFISKLARKIANIPELNVKDLNNDKDLFLISKDSTTSSKLKGIKKKDLKKKCIAIDINKIDDQSEKLNLEDELSNKPKTILKAKDLNKYYKKSKDEIKRIKKKKKYLEYREEDNCFLFSLRHITGAFPFRDYMFLFKGLSVDKQLELANKILKQNNLKELNEAGKFIGSLNQLKKMLAGSFLFLFLVDGLLHSESLVDGQFNPLMQEQMKKILDTKMIIDIYRYD